MSDTTNEKYLLEIKDLFVQYNTDDAVVHDAATGAVMMAGRLLNG